MESARIDPGKELQVLDPPVLLIVGIITKAQREQHSDALKVILDRCTAEIKDLLDPPPVWRVEYCRFGNEYTERAESSVDAFRQVLEESDERIITALIAPNGRRIEMDALKALVDDIVVRLEG